MHAVSGPMAGTRLDHKLARIIRYDDFRDQLSGDDGPVVPYFPVWMGLQGRDPEPQLTISPDSDPITYHWHYPGDRIYRAHDDDDGLRWDLIEWTENP